MDFALTLQQEVVAAIKALYQIDFEANKVSVANTRKEFVGDYTVVMFPLVAILKQSPEQIGNAIGGYLKENSSFVQDFNVIKGFLNLELKTQLWADFLENAYANDQYGNHPKTNKNVLLEYCSPNTNKPLHLGHIRNILLGWSCSKILEAAGDHVIRTQVINDRGIAICKSMLAWKKFANGETPQTSGIKSDHFVGNYYVLFETKFKEEYEVFQNSSEGLKVYETNKKANQESDAFFKDYKNTYFNTYSALGKEAREMLLDWEKGEPNTIALWKTMNEWVISGFNETHKALGVDFHENYFESETYLLGKDLIEKGLKEGIFYQKEDTSVWIDLTEEKLDHKLVLRSDGTSVYMTQDIGMAHIRYEKYKMDSLIYVVADEQNYHFQVLFEILKKMKEPYAAHLYHLAYGMVELTTGKMKSREGTVVDADDLIKEVIQEAENEAAERGDINALPAEAKKDILTKIGMAALKYHIIKVNPKKKMVFDPKESVDLQGQTGPYIQYSYVRANGLINKINQENWQSEKTIPSVLEPQEKDLLIQLYDYPNIIKEAAAGYDPSVIANFTYSLAKSYHKFWHDLPIIKAPTPEKDFRIKLSILVKHVLQHSMDLLGIPMPNRM